MILLLVACTPQAPPIPTPQVPTVVEVPPEPSTPPPTPAPVPYAPPPPETLLRSVPPTELVDLCGAAIPGPIPSASVDCNGVSVLFPSVSYGERLQTCVHDLGESFGVASCLATVGDLFEVREAEATCGRLAFPTDAFLRLQSCGEPALQEPPQCPDVVSTTPADGALGEFIGRTVAWNLSGPLVTTAAAQLFDANGTPVAGVLDNPTGSRLEFTPDAWLPPTSTFTTELSWCGGFRTATSGFSTSGWGVPLNPLGLHALTYQLDLVDVPLVAWQSPPSLGPTLRSLVAGNPVVGFEITPGDLHATTGWTEAATGLQDLCVPTRASIANLSGNPVLDQIELEVWLADTSLGSVDLQMAFSSDARTGAATFSGLVDTRPLVEVLAPGGTDQAVCDLLAAGGDSCLACPDGAIRCMEILVEDVPFSERITPVVQRSEGTVASDPLCVP